MASSAFVYLASQSPRRRQLLQQLGVRFELLLPDDGEDAEALEAVKRGESAGGLRAPRHARQARCGARAAAAPRPARGADPGADTTVAIGRAILGKPADDADARAMLRSPVGPHAPRDQRRRGGHRLRAFARR